MNVFRAHVAGWICQFLGTLFLWLDSIRVGIRLPREGVRLGDSPELDRWYYHWASPFGFFLLLIGFGLCGIALWLSRPPRSSTAEAPPEPPVAPAPPVAVDDETRLDLLMKRAELHESKIQDRRKYQWQFNFSTWTGIVVGAYGIGVRGLLVGRGGDVGLWFVLVVVGVLYGWWRVFLQTRFQEDERERDRRLREIDQLLAGQATGPGGRTPTWGYVVFEILFTLMLLAVASWYVTRV
jgi:hypothetical protein